MIIVWYYIRMRIETRLVPIAITLFSLFAFQINTVSAHDQSQHTEPVSPWHNFISSLGFNFDSNLFQIAAVPTSIPSATPTVISNPEITPSIRPQTETDVLASRIIIANIQLEKLSGNTVSISIAQKRQEIMKSLAIKDASRFLSVVLNDNVRSKLLPEAQKYVEKREVKQGNLEILHIDDFQNPNNSKFEYTLNTNSKYKIISPIKLSIGNAGKVNVSAYSLDNLLVLDSGDSSIRPISAAQDSAEATGNQRVLALITEMEGNKSNVTVEEVSKALFDPTSHFQQYYKNQSYGKIYFTGKVYKISLNRSPVSGSCSSGVSLYDKDVIDAIQAQKINLSSFDRILFIPPIGYCSGVGKSIREIEGRDYSLSESWVDWHSFRYTLDKNALNKTLAHELGHAIGTMHSNALICEKDSSCSHHEYGNYFDMMGIGVGDFNALYKEQLKWLGPKDFLNITKSGDYIINSIESTSTKVYKAAKVIPSTGPLSVMYIERRANAVQWNSLMDMFTSSPQRNGILLNIPENPFLMKTTAPELIDMTPNYPEGIGAEDFKNVALSPGGSKFTYSNSGVTFSNVRQNINNNDQTSFQVDIEDVGCIPQKPEIFQEQYERKGLGGTIIYLSKQIKNKDPVCMKSSDFIIEPYNLPSGWSIKNIETDISQGRQIPPLGTKYLQVPIVIPEDAVPNFYYISFKVINVNSGLSVIGSTVIEIKPRPEIISIDKKRVQAGDEILITTNFKDEFVNVSAFGSDYVNLFNGQINFKGGSGTIKVTIPKELNEDNSSCRTYKCPRPIPSGDYKIIMYALGGQSEPVTLGIGPAESKSISITSPTQGNVYEKSKEYQIKWTSLGVSKVTIDLLDHRGKFVRNIIKNINNVGQYSWTVPTDLDLDSEDLYSIRISNSDNDKITTKSQKFEIVDLNEPKIEVLKNEMKLKYDENNKESSLRINQTAVITAPNNSDILIPIIYAFNVAISNLENKYAWGDTVYTANTPLDKSNNYYVIKAGKKATFEIITSVIELNKKFPGTYTASLRSFAYGENYIGFKIAPENYSNAVTIIGETSPYITDAKLDDNKVLLIKGVRFGSSPMILSIGDQKFNVNPSVVGGEDTVSISLSGITIKGNYLNFQLTNLIEGDSNAYYLEIL